MDNITDEKVAVNIPHQDHTIQDELVREIIVERSNQDAKWGEQNHFPHYWVGIMGEEFGELCQAVNESVFDNGTDKGGYENLKTEAVQVAAVALAFLECLERNKAEWFEGDEGA